MLPLLLRDVNYLSDRAPLQRKKRGTVKKATRCNCRRLFNLLKSNLVVIGQLGSHSLQIVLLICRISTPLTAIITVTLILETSILNKRVIVQLQLFAVLTLLMPSVETWLQHVRLLTTPHQWIIVIQHTKDIFKQKDERHL